MKRILWQTGCLAAALGLAPTAFGQTNAVSSGDWSTGATWDNGVPSGSSPAVVNGGHSVTINSSGNFTNLLDVGTIEGETGSVSIVGGDLTIFDSDGVTEPNTPSLRLGVVAGSTGNFSISDGALFVDGGAPSDFAIGDIIIGDNGTGTMAVTGGLVSTNDELFVGLWGNGTLNASGGTIDVLTRNMLIGFGGAATGVVNLSGSAVINVAGFMFSSFEPGATSTIEQTGGTLNVGLAFVHGRNGNATYNHSGGSIVVPAGSNGDFVVGDGGVNSVYNISGTASVNNGRHFMVGVFDGSEGTVNQTGGTIEVGGLLRVGVDGNGTWNQSAGSVAVAGSVFLGDFDTSLGVYTISGGTLNVSGNLNVGGALASNAPPPEERGEPTLDPFSAQGQALDANGTFVVVGTGAEINVAGNLLANPADKAAIRNGPGQENDSILRFTLGSAGISTINIGGIADLDGAVIDVDDAAGYFTANPAASLTLIDAAGGFGNVFTITAAEAAGNGRGFSLAPGDDALYELAIQASGGGEQLVLTRAAGGGLAADFNNDGFVDGTDLAAWKDAYGSTNAGDANNDGVSDGADFLVWQREFTGPPPAAAPAVVGAVPEPASLALAGLAVGGLTTLRWRKQAVRRNAIDF